MLTVDAMPAGQLSSRANPTSQLVAGLADQFRQATDCKDVPWKQMQGRLQTARTANAHADESESAGGKSNLEPKNQTIY